MSFFGGSRSHRGISPDAARVLDSIPGVNSANLPVYSARVLSSSEDSYKDIIQAVNNGTEHGFRIRVKNIVRIVRDGEKDFEHTEFAKRFRMLLWHGTSQTRAGQILQNGFRLPTPTGQMFGAGIYFADRISKSANYTGGKASGQVAFMLLCDVFLGKIYNSKNPKPSHTDVPLSRFDSVMCTGRRVPDRAENKTINGSIFPYGRTIDNDKFPTYTVEYNEYIVYDPDKVRIKYLVEVEFC